MNTIVEIMVAVAWLAIAGMLLWGVVDAFRKLLWNQTELPFFRVLEGQGLTLRQVEEAVGIDELGRAVRRCTYCRARADCGQHPVSCPNEPLFRRAKALGAAS